MPSFVDRLSIGYNKIVECTVHCNYASIGLVDTLQGFHVPCNGMVFLNELERCHWDSHTSTLGAFNAELEASSSSSFASQRGPEEALSVSSSDRIMSYLNKRLQLFLVFFESTTSHDTRWRDMVRGEENMERPSTQKRHCGRVIICTPTATTVSQSLADARQWAFARRLYLP